MKKLLSLVLAICLVFSLGTTAFAADSSAIPTNVIPSSETIQITSAKSTISTAFSASVSPMTTSRPGSGTSLPYSGSFSGVNGTIYSNYYFFTNGATQFYVDWNVTPDYPIYTEWHINVYRAGTNAFVMSSRQFDTSAYTGDWNTRFYNLDSAYNYYISFVNDGPPDQGTSISGSFKVRLS